MQKSEQINSNIQLNTSLIILQDSKPGKQLTVNKKDSRLNKNRIAAKNEAIQNNICTSIDGTISNAKINDYRRNKAEYQKEQRRNKRK